MIIEKYTGYFHDGGLVDIQHHDNKIVLSLESAEMDLNDLQDEIKLSEQNTIKGKLYLEVVKSITINDIPFNGILKMPYDNGEIMHLKITSDNISLEILWNNYPPKSRINDFSAIEIEVKEMRWENIPDLPDPYRK